MNLDTCAFLQELLQLSLQQILTLDLLDLIFFRFAIGNLCCWDNFLGLVYFVLDFISIKIFMAFKRRKMLKLQIFLQIADVVSDY